MLNKFEATESTESAEPQLSIMEPWARVVDLTERDLQDIHAMIRGVDLHPNRGAEGFNSTAMLEEQLAGQFPELNQAYADIREGLNGLHGWHIEWRQRARGEAIDYDHQTPSDELRVINIIRGPDEFHENDGWIVGSVVGVIPPFQNLGVWIEISPDIEALPDRGWLHDLSMMHAIDLSPPEIIGS